MNNNFHIITSCVIYSYIFDYSPCWCILNVLLWKVSTWNSSIPHPNSVMDGSRLLLIRQHSWVHWRRTGLGKKKKPQRLQNECNIFTFGQFIKIKTLKKTTDLFFPNWYYFIYLLNNYWYYSVNSYIL